MRPDKWIFVHLVVVVTRSAEGAVIARWASWSDGKTRREMNFAPETLRGESPSPRHLWWPSSHPEKRIGDGHGFHGPEHESGSVCLPWAASQKN